MLPLKESGVDDKEGHGGGFYGIEMVYFLLWVMVT